MSQSTKVRDNIHSNPTEKYKYSVITKRDLILHNITSLRGAN